MPKYGGIQNDLGFEWIDQVAKEVLNNQFNVDELKTLLMHPYFFPSNLYTTSSPEESYGTELHL